MMKKNLFFKNIYKYNFFLFILFSTFIILFTPIYAINNFTEEVSIVKTTNFELLGTNFGKLRIKINAYEMQQYESGNIILTGGIKIILLDNKFDKEKSYIYIQANKLSYNKKKNLYNRR